LAPIRAEVPNPVPIEHKDIPVDQDKENNKSAGDIEEKPKTVIVEVLSSL
jgi:hypothetical protein